MGWFESQSSKEKKTAVKNVLAIMLADGKIDQSEKAFLAQVCGRVGLSQEQLQDILNKPKSIKFTPAKSEQERFCQIVDMVFMMIADGEIDQREMDLCMSIAMQLGFRPSVVPDLLNQIVSKIKQGRDRTQVTKDVEVFLAS